MLVYIDFPESAEAKENVKDAESNRRLADQFRIKEKDYPTVLLTDKDGQPIGILEGGFGAKGSRGRRGEADNNEAAAKRPGGELGAGRSERIPRDAQAVAQDRRHESKSDGEIKTLSGEEKQKPSAKLLDLLEINDLDRFYGPEIKEWAAMLPADLPPRPARRYPR